MRKRKPQVIDVLADLLRGISRFLLLSLITMFLLWNIKGSVTLSYETTLPKPPEIKWTSLGKKALDIGKGAIQVAKGVSTVL